MRKYCRREDQSTEYRVDQLLLCAYAYIYHPVLLLACLLQDGQLSFTPDLDQGS